MSDSAVLETAAETLGVSPEIAATLICTLIIVMMMPSECKCKKETK